MVVLLPALMIMLVLAMQLALWGLGAHALEAAVAEGGADARAENGSVADAKALVLLDVRELGGGFLLHPRVTAKGETDEYVAIAATAAIPTLVPGIRLFVRATSSGPLQEFRATG